MNFTLRLFVAISTYGIIQETSGELMTFEIEDERSAPLALIKRHDDDRLERALPQEYIRNKDKLTFRYYYNDTQVKFLTACAASIYSFSEQKIQRKWRQRDDIINDGHVLFTRSQEKIRTSCKDLAEPTIRKTEIGCSHLNGIFYEAGYSVTTGEEEAEVQFITLYKICYSTVSGVIYSLHHIAAPNLLLLQAPEYYTMSSKVFPTKLDKNFKGIEKEFTSNKDYVFYNLVELFNLPTLFYRRAAFVLMNYIQVANELSLLKGMAKYENFVRLFAKQTNTQLTIYSGTYATHEESRTHTITKYFSKTETWAEQVPVKSLWRIIKDYEGNGVIIVTQYSIFMCDTSNLLCGKENITMLGTYAEGGCTYLCSNVDKNMIHKLGLPNSVKILGNLELKFPFNSKERGNSSSQSESTSTQQFIDIKNFEGTGVFMNTLSRINGELGDTVQKDLPPILVLGKSPYYGYNDSYDDDVGTTDTGGGFTGRAEP